MSTTPRDRWARRLSFLAEALSPSLVVPTPAAPTIGAPPPPPAPLGQRFDERMRATLDSVRNTITGLGGDYDKGSAARPDTLTEDLSYSELQALYRRNGYARKFIEKVPQDSTRNGWFLKDGGDDADPMEDEDERLDVRGKVREAHQWGRLFGGAWILIVTDDDVPPEYQTGGALSGQWLAQPLDLSRIRKVLNLVVLERLEASVYAYDTDPRSPTFRQARLYQVNPNTGGVMSDAAYRSGIVHASRMVYFPGALLPPQLRQLNGGVDDSVIQAVWNQVQRKESHEQALSVLSQELQTAVLKMEDLAGIATSDQAAYFDTRMKLLAKSKGVLGMVLLGQGEEYDQRPGTVSGMGELDNTLRQSLAAVFGMPQVVLYGDTPGGLNTDGASHRSLWQANISASQSENYSRNLRKLYRVIYAAKDGPTCGVVPPSFTVEYRSIEDLTPQGVTLLRAAQAGMDKTYIDAQVLDPDEVRATRFGERGWLDEYPPLTDRTTATDPAVEAALRAEVASLNPADAAAVQAAAGLMPDASIDAFAEKLTAAGVQRCEHGSSNRCRICGIERMRDFETNPDGTPRIGPDGQPVWSVKWRPIYRPVDPKAAAEEEAAAAAVATIEEPPPPTTPADVRTDADDSVWIAVMWPQALAGDLERARQEAEAAVGLGKLEAPGGPAHVTLLYVGAVADPERVEALRVAADALLEEHRPLMAEGWGLGVFDPTPASDGRWPVYVCIRSAAMEALHSALADAMLTEEERRRAFWYNPHLTLGYTEELPMEARERLYAAREGRGSWTLATVVMHRGGQEVQRWALRPRE